MATADEYAAWIVANEAKRGTPDFETVAAAYREAKAAEGAGGKAQGFAMGLADPIHGGAQLLTRALPEGFVKAGNRLNNWLAENTGLVAKLPEGGVDQAVREREQAYQTARTAAGREGMDWARLGGNILSPVNIGIGAAAPAVASLGGRAAIGATLGGASAAMEPVTSSPVDEFWRAKASQVGIGTAGGAAAPFVASGLGRMVSPKASTNADMALLKAEGVRPTIGQTLGGGFNTLEEKMMSLPVVGDAISSARQRAQGQFNQAAVQRALTPIGGKASDIGHGGIAKAHTDLSAAFDAAKAQLGNFQLDRQASAELLNLHQLTRNLPPKERRAFDTVWGYLDNEVSQNGSLVADAFRRFDSKAGMEAKRFSGANDAYQQKAGEAIQELQRIVLDAAERANPQASEALQAAKTGWANLVRVENASNRAANTGGVFTPGQLNLAVRASDKSARKAGTAQGKALMQDLGSAAQSVLGNKVADSGTAGRLLAGAGALGGAWYLEPTAAMGLIGAAGGYSPPVQALLRGLVSSRPAAAQPIAQMLEKSSPMFAPGLGLLGVNVLE
jgi:hypothetical protein